MSFNGSVATCLSAFSALLTLHVILSSNQKLALDSGSFCGGPMVIAFLPVFSRWIVEEVADNCTGRYTQ